MPLIISITALISANISILGLGDRNGISSFSVLDNSQFELFSFHVNSRQSMIKNSLIY